MMVPKSGTEINTEKPTAIDITGPEDAEKKWYIVWHTYHGHSERELLEPRYAWNRFTKIVSWLADPFVWCTVGMDKRFTSGWGNDRKHMNIRLTWNGTLEFQNHDIDQYGWAPQNWLADDPKGTVVKLDTLRYSQVSKIRHLVAYYILDDGTFWRVDSANPTLLEKGELHWDDDIHTIIFKLKHQWTNATVKNKFTDKIEVDLDPAGDPVVLGSELRIKQRVQRITCPRNEQFFPYITSNFF
jgi:hypothetical protein